VIGTIKTTLYLADPEEQVVVEVDGRDRRAFEMKGRKDFGLPPFGDLQAQIKSMSESWMAWLCWHALVVRGGQSQFGDWEQFEARLVGVEPDEQATGDDPTQPAP
jgi:hypothetical protein